MIVVQTPLRISFFGGGTDLQAFSSLEGGRVLSSAINRYVYVIIKERHDDRIRAGYSRTELVDTVDELEHDLIRESLRLSGIRSGVEISTMADIPSRGSGLGSSSTVTVGLLNAMHHHRGRPCDADTLARQACRIEIEELGQPIGRQDQYIAAYGGRRLIDFDRCGSVRVASADVEPKVWRRLDESLMLFYTGVTRKADVVLREQQHNVAERLEFLREIKALAVRGRDALRADRLDEFGRLLDAGWRLKRRLAGGVSSPAIDAMYSAALHAGALGGKIAGAGGGGYLLLYVPDPKQEAVRAALAPLRELRFNFEPDGSKVILNHRRSLSSSATSSTETNHEYSYPSSAHAAG